MGMRMIGDQGVGEGTTISQITPLGEHMLVQGQGETQVCPLLGGRGEFPRNKYFKLISKSSSHQISMVSIGREKRSRLGCWK
jgi:hypothetical protein